MRRFAPPIWPRATLAALALWVGCALGLGLGLGAGMAQAQGARPGTEIVNIAQISVDNGALVLSAEARFTVARPTSTGVLTAWELDNGLSPGPFRDIVFARGDYQVNPFFPLPEPVDRSTLTGTGAPIDRSAPLRVFRSDRIRLGVPVFFTLQDAGLNFDPAAVETVVVTLTDAATGDTETLRFYETGPNTGEFSAWINTTAGGAVPSNGVMATRALSVITAQYNDATNLRNNLAVAVDVGPIDPFGVVFDSATGARLDGIEVTLINHATGQLATVYGDDMQAAFPARVVTGSRFSDASGRVYQMEPGGFRFPFVDPGTYRFEIGPSATHQGPTTRSDAQMQALAGGPFTVTTGSRLDPFVVQPGPPLRVDIPLDALATVQITREASQSEAGIGDFIEFTVTVTSAESRAVTITDNLPLGMAFLPGTVLINGQPASPRLSADGRALILDLPTIAAGQTTVITYGAQVLPPATAGQRLISRSSVTTPGVRALVADHSLRIRDTLGLDQVAILGQISAGGCAPTPDAPAHDLSGIRVLLENGEFALTDSDGRFTFRDIYRRPRVVQMDVTTLPPGARPVSCYASPRSAGSAISQFVDLRPGMMGRVEFYLDIDTPPAPDAAPPPDRAPQSPLEIYDQAWLDGPGASHPLGFVAPAPGHMPGSEAIDVVILRPAGAQVVLAVNGEPVPAIRSEPMIRSSDGQRELVRFRAVRVGEGRNALTLDMRDASGASLLAQTRDVLYGTRPARVDLVQSSSQLESDGQSQPRIVLRLTDAAGIPIRPGTQVTVAVDAPFGFARDGAPRSASPASARAPLGRTTATVARDGLITLPMAPTLQGGAARLRIPLGPRELALAVPIAVPDRPWVLVGLAEGTLAHDTVRQHMRRDGDIGNALSGRVALFAEGVIRGEWLLTLRYDSAQQRDDFYGIDPDADYIVYGDRSTQGSAAPSRFPLYLRLRREGAEFLVGDFNTDLNAGGVTITQQVTGARAVFENDQWRVMGFAAQNETRQVEDRIALNGTIGPYQLGQADIVPHSPHVRLITVSRFDASEELTSQTLQAGRDYVISYATGQLFLRRATPAFTPDLHRQVLVVDYETDTAVRDAMIAGIRAELQVTDALRLGATAVRATRVEGRDLSINLTGVDLSYQVTDALRLGAETLFAQRRFADRVETATRSELRADYQTELTSLEAYLRHQRGQVALTASDRAVDTTIAGATLRHQLWQDPETPDRTLAVEGVFLAENDRAGARRVRDGELVLTRTTGDSLSQSIGLRVIRSDTAGAEHSDLRLVYRGTWASGDGRLTQSLGLESALRGGGALAGDQVTLGAGYAISDRVQMFGLLEIDRLHSTDREARRLTFGAEFTAREGRSYRSGLSFAGSEATGQGGSSVFVGADHAYDIGGGTTANLGADAQWDMGAADSPMARATRQPLGTSIGNPTIGESFGALRAGLRHDAESWGVGLDAETRLTQNSRSQNLRLRVEGDVTESWTMGSEAFWGRVQQTGQAPQEDIELRLSAAHRAGPRDPITLLQADLRQDDQGGVETTTAIASVYRSHYLSEIEFLNLRYGVKYTAAGLRSGQVSDVLSLIGAEYRRDLSDTVDLGLHVAGLHAERTGVTTHSLGLSLGITPFDNGWLSFGYNLTGFHDPDFAALGQTDQGPFVQFRLKFDADSLRGMFQ